MTKLFVDTNAFLGFYAYSSDDLAQLNKLVDEMKAGKIELLLTDQVINEFNRNRESKIAETLRSFTEKAEIDKFPRLVQHYDEYLELAKVTKAYKDLKEKVMKALDKDILERKLPADVIFAEIVKVAKPIKTTPEIIEAAQFRMAVGNPPGKNGSLGDAINWELLLKTCGKKTELHIVTQDKDYLSPIDRTRFSEFLVEEWREKCGGEIHLFGNLRELFKKIAPEIKLSSATTTPPANTVISVVASPAKEEDEFEKAVQNLESSGAFSTTHWAIASMPPIWVLTNSQIARLLRAAVENNQISWICSDSDVSAFFKELYAMGKEHLDADVAEKFSELYL
jgi:predicted nucleic acid-binding protein